jgi:hypothetical protein
MKGLSYLLITTLKNRILSLKRKPALAILYGVIIVSIIAMLVVYNTGEGTVSTDIYVDIRILYGIVAAVAMLYTISYVMTGLSTGSTLFTMSDVGLLFVSPISSKKILLYGLIKQMATTLFSAVFILYQLFNLRDNFGLMAGDLFYLFVIDAIILFFCQLLSIAIYIFSNGNPLRKNIVRVIYYGIIAAIIISVFILQKMNGGTLLNNALVLADNKIFQFIPVIGWSVMFFSAGVEGSVLYLVVSILLFFVSSVIIILLFTSGDADYYEDVLHSTEFNYNRLQDAKNGKNTVVRNVKVKDKVTGIKKGSGSSAIFYKHLLEKKRSSRFIFIDSYTVFACIGAAVAGRYIPSAVSGYIILAALIYIQFFMTMLGKLAMELQRPYIYMIPEKSLNKVIAASFTMILKNCIDGLIVFAVVCVFNKTSPLLNLFLALAYSAAGLFFVSFNLLTQRLFGGQPNKIISLTLGLTLFIVLMIPGIGLSVAAISLLPSTLTFLGTLPFTFLSTLISVLIIAFCGDLLDKAELTAGS